MDEQKLQEMYQMVVENNRMLREMRRNAMMGRIGKVVWWILLLVVFPAVGWLFIQPYLAALQGITPTDQSSSSTMQQAQDLLKGLGW